MRLARSIAWRGSREGCRRLRKAAQADPLLLALREPDKLIQLDQPGWQDLLARARASGLLVRLEAMLIELGLLGQIPEKARLHLAEAHCFLRRNQTDVRFEADRVGRALARLHSPVIILKGGAYLLANLPPADRRFAADLDILVRHEHLATVERTLRAAGWRSRRLADYDDRYYREWMHEIPALWHPERLFAVDVHHTILPRTSRYQPDTEALFAAAVTLEGRALKVLCPADMVLHGAAHLFTEEFASGLRQLADLHDLLEHFGKERSFWSELLARSRRHGLERILYYLIRYVRPVFGTSIPDEVTRAVRPHRPNLIVRAMMDAAVMSALRPKAFGEWRPGRHIALRVLHLRSHWLKMPPLPLARHLLIKTWHRLRVRFPARWPGFGRIQEHGRAGGTTSGSS
jgi:Uncharacterised nucleotidyltransferase